MFRRFMRLVRQVFWTLVRQPTTLEFHQQDTNAFCGPACAQMILSSLGRRTDSPNDQANLRDEIRTHVALRNWDTSPHALAATLEKPPGPSALRSNPGFTEKGDKDKMTLTARAIASLENSQTPSAVVVWGTKHWLMVVASNKNTEGALGLMLYNPAPYPSASTKCNNVPPKSHNKRDNCGEGYQHCTSDISVNRAVRYHHASIEGWCGGYLTSKMSLKSGQEDPSGSFVLVCDKGTAAQSVVPATEPPIAGSNDQLVTDEKLIVDIAWNALKSYDLLGQTPWDDVSTVARPARIYRKDLKKYYYAVPYFSAKKANIAAVLVDGHAKADNKPTYMESIAAVSGQVMAQIDSKVIEVAQPIDDTLKLATAEDPGQLPPLWPTLPTGETVIGRSITVDGEEITLRIEDLNTDTPLVWEPCLESLSPFDPFYLFKNPRNPELPLYVRSSDLMHFGGLTTDIFGGGKPQI